MFAYHETEDRGPGFDEAHPTCEACREQLCDGSGEACGGGACGYLAAAPVGFAYDGHAFCEGSCADDARATLAEDLTRADLLSRRLPCPTCGPERQELTHDQPDPYGGTHTLHCGACYDADFDGESFVSKCIVGYGRNKLAAIDDWNEKVEDVLAEREGDGLHWHSGQACHDPACSAEVLS